MKKTNERDWLDYVDLLVKIVFGGIFAFGLMAIQEIKKEQQQEIDNSLKFGEFTKSLISNLLIQDSTHLQSDIALITLNHTIGDKNPGLVADLGARIVENYYQNKTNSDLRTMHTIFAIVEKRDTATYHALQLFAADYVNKSNNDRKTIDNVGKADLVSAVNSISNKELDKISLAQSTATVFMQVNKNAENQYAQDSSLFNQIKAKGYNTPAIEVVANFNYKNAVKYYYQADKATAYEVERLAAKKLGVNSLSVIKLDNPKARKGLIELWCNY